ncbi:MAG: polysaccharide biosynthesis protein [Bacteroidota bacterium]
MSLLRQLAGQTVIYGIGQLVPRIILYIISGTYLTYRLASKGEYAIYLDLYAYATVLIVFFSYRMDTALFRFGSRPEELDRVYRTAFLPMILTSMVLVGGAWVFSEQLAELLTYPGQGYYVRWFSWIIAFDVLALLPYAKLRLQGMASTFVSFKLLNVLLTVTLILFFLEGVPRMGLAKELSALFPYVSSEVDYVFVSNLIVSLIVMVGLVLNQRLSSWDIDWDLWRRMISYSWPLIIVGMAGSINQFFGVPLQKWFLGASFEANKDEAAVYGAVQKIPVLLALLTTAYNYAAEPFFFKNADDASSKTLYGDIAHYFIVTAGLVALGILVYVDLFAYLIGPAYREGLYLIPILLMAYLFLGLYYNVSIWYKLSDQTMWGAIIALIGASITVFGSIALLPRMGVVASAWIALMCYVMMVILAMAIGRKYYPINYPLFRMLRQLGFILALMVSAVVIGGWTYWARIGSGTLILITYCLVSWLWDGDRLRSYL